MVCSATPPSDKAAEQQRKSEDSMSKTPLELLAQTCDKIAGPGVSSMSKSILPLETSHLESFASVPRSKEHLSHHRKACLGFGNGTTSPQSATRSPVSIGQTLPPTLPTASSKYNPYMNAAHSAMSPFGNPYAGSLAAFGPAQSTAMSACLPPFISPCRDPCCRACPPNPGVLNPMSMMSANRCPLGCIQCTPQSHVAAAQELWWFNAYNYALSSNAAAPGAGMWPGLAPPSMAAPGLSGLTPQLSAAGSTASTEATTTPATTTKTTPSSSHPDTKEKEKDTQHVCHWLLEGKPCGRNFPSSDELCEHFRAEHSAKSEGATTTPSPKSTASSATVTSPLSVKVSSRTVTTTASQSAGSAAGSKGRISPRTYLAMSTLASLNQRYHPYGRPAPNPLAGFPANPGYNLSLSAPFTQRLPGSLLLP